jgi:hypothetical protein
LIRLMKKANMGTGYGRPPAPCRARVYGKHILSLLTRRFHLHLFTVIRSLPGKLRHVCDT